MEKVVWIIGANSEVAKEIVLELDRKSEFDNVILASRNVEQLKCFVEENNLEDKASVFSLDLTNKESVELLVKDAPAPNGIILCAGYLYWESPIDYEHLKDVMDTNLTGNIYLLELILPTLRNTGGYVVGFSSTAGEMGTASSKYYATSKAGLNIYLESFKLENEKYGIKTILLKPGYIDTKMYKQRSDRNLKFLTVSAKAVAEKTVKYIQKYKSVTAFLPWYWRLFILLAKIKRAITHV